MKTRIRFTEEMVCALRGGVKTQTRRLMKPQPLSDVNHIAQIDLSPPRIDGAISEDRFMPGYRQIPPAPYGKAGRLLWVAETERMKRGDSAITLEVTGLRVEKLQDINDAYAIAEGVEGHYIENGWYWRDYRLSDEDAAVSPMLENAKDSFRSLWESIYGTDSWAANPWVWVYDFIVHKQNIDKLKEKTA